MATPADRRVQFDRVFDKLLVAGWIHRHWFTGAKGHHVEWTAPGAQRVQLLKKLITAFGIQSYDGTTEIVPVISLKGAGRPVERLSGQPRQFWREMLREVGVHTSTEETEIFAHICLGWAPGTNTRIKFG